MPPAAKRPQQSPLAVPFAVAAVPVGIGLSWLEYPGFLAAWVGVLIATFNAVSPMFTGPKKNGVETPASEYEKQLARRFRAWQSLRVRLFLSPALWPGKRVALLPFVGLALAVAVWFLPVLGSGHAFDLGAGGAPLVVPVIPESWEAGLRAVNAYAAMALVVAGLDTLNRAAAEREPRPYSGVLDLVDRVKTSVPARVALIACLIVPASLVTVGVLHLKDVPEIAPWLPSPTIQAVALGVAASLAVVIGVFSKPLIEAWRERCEAAERWAAVWPELKEFKQAEPRLVDHAAYPDIDLQVDTFDAPSAFGTAGMFKLGDAIGLQLAGHGHSRDLAILSTPEIDQQGQPKPGTRHPLRFRVASWPKDQKPDLARPDTSTEIAELAVDSILYWAATANKATPDSWPLLSGFETISTAPEGAEPVDADAKPDLLMETPDAEEAPEYTVAYACTIADASGLGHAGAAANHVYSSGFGELVEARAVPDPYGATTLYVGALTADSTTLQNPGLLDDFARIDEEDLWGRRWSDTVLSAGIVGGQKPHTALVRHKKVHEFVNHNPHTGSMRPPRPMSIEVMPFQVLQGVDVGTFLRTKVETTLTTALDSAPFVYLMAWKAAGSSRQGERNSGAFAVAWSKDPIEMNPARLYANLSASKKTATAKAETNQVATIVLGAGLAKAFEASKLARPELIQVENLTGPDTDSSIWRVTLRLYGGVTTDQVRKSLGSMRSLIGCDWMQVTGAQDGCVIVCGARPNAPDVQFSGPRARANEDYCTAIEWEAAFEATNLIGTDGLAPKLLSLEPLPGNEKVQQATFKIPLGRSIDDFREPKRLGTLRSTTSNKFIDVQPADTPSEVLLRISREDPVPFPAPIDWDAMNDGGLAVPVASGVDGAPVRFDLDLDPHLLVLGGTGTGKSITLGVLLTGFLLRGFDCYLADPVKFGADFQFAKSWMKAVTGEVLETSRMLDELYAEVQRRKRFNASRGVGSITDLPSSERPRRIVIFIDEFTSLMMADRVPKATDGMTPEMLQEIAEQQAIANAKQNIGAKVGRIAREARSAGVHLVLATQELKKDTMDQIPGGRDLKGNLARLVLGKLSFGSLMSALKDATAAPDLGEAAGMKGRGMLESNQHGPTKILQSWYGTEGSHLSHNAGMVEQLRAHVDEMTEQMDLAGMVAADAATTNTAGVFGQVLDDAPADVIELVAPVEEVTFAGPDLAFDFDDDNEGEVAPVNPLAQQAPVLTPPVGFNPFDVPDDEDEDDVLPEAPQSEPVQVAPIQRPFDLFATAIDAIGEDDEPDDGAPYDAVMPAPIPTADTAFEVHAPTLFLDVDNTISPLSIPVGVWDDAEILPDTPHGAVWVSRTMLRRLGQLRCEIVWLTDWDTEAAPTFDALLGRETRTLAQPNAVDGWRKSAALLSVQMTAQVPLAWADDHQERHEEDVQRVRDRFPGIHLVRPSPCLTPADLDALEALFGTDAPAAAPATAAAPSATASAPAADLFAPPVYSNAPAPGHNPLATGLFD